MKQLTHETSKLLISTVLLNDTVNIMDSLTGENEEGMPYESMVFNLKNGRPDFSNPIETKRYSSQSEAQAGHKELVAKYDDR